MLHLSVPLHLCFSEVFRGLMIVLRETWYVQLCRHYAVQSTVEKRHNACMVIWSLIIGSPLARELSQDVVNLPAWLISYYKLQCCNTWQATLAFCIDLSYICGLITMDVKTVRLGSYTLFCMHKRATEIAHVRSDVFSLHAPLEPDLTCAYACESWK